MVASLRQWQNEIKAGGNKANVTADTLLAAETEAHAVYDARVREMTYSDRDVTPHGGNNQKMVISECLSMLARGWDDLFRTTVEEYAGRASEHPARYSPLSYALQTVSAVLDHRSAPLRPLPDYIHPRVAPSA